VLGVSEYHRRFLAEAYDLERVACVPNGIDLDRFDPTIKKIKGRCVYASSPDRGLLALLRLWPKIIGNEKRPELVIAYGFDNIDKWIASGRHDLAEFKAEVMALIEKTPQVVFRGRLPQDELAKLYCESYAWLYPSDFLETSAISAMEAMAGGCVPVCSSTGALKETVGDGGLVVWGPGRTRSNPYSSAWREFYVACARGVIFEVQTRMILRAKALERAKSLTWDQAYTAHWKPLIEGLLSEKVAPSLPAHDGVNVLVSGADLPRELALRDASLSVTSPNGADFLGREVGTEVGLTPRASGSPLGHLVGGVVGAGSEEQVIGPDATAVVAAVEDAQIPRNGTVHEHPGDTVSPPHRLPEIDLTVAGTVQAGGPDPAVARSVDLRPEARQVRRRKLKAHR
jgi:hypothetical protein